VDRFGVQTINSFDSFDHLSSTISFALINSSGSWSSAGRVLKANAKDYFAAAHIFVMAFAANTMNRARVIGFRWRSWYWYSPRWRRHRDFAWGGPWHAWYGAALCKQLTKRISSKSVPVLATLGSKVAVPLDGHFVCCTGSPVSSGALFPQELLSPATAQETRAIPGSVLLRARAG
jgi:hypothetical protein